MVERVQRPRTGQGDPRPGARRCNRHHVSDRLPGRDPGGFEGPGLRASQLRPFEYRLPSAPALCGARGRGDEPGPTTAGRGRGRSGRTADVDAALGFKANRRPAVSSQFAILRKLAKCASGSRWPHVGRPHPCRRRDLVRSHGLPCLGALQVTCPVCNDFRSVLVVILRADDTSETLELEGTEYRWCFWCRPEQWTRHKARSILLSQARSRTPGHPCQGREAGRPEQPPRLLHVGAESG